MKKFISTILIYTLLLQIFIVPSFCITDDTIHSGNNSTIEFSDLTAEDIFNMNTDELSELVKEYERIYDPFGSYANQSVITNETFVNDVENILLPEWTSGNYDQDDGTYTEEGCHEIVTVAACEILSNNKGFFPMIPTPRRQYF